MKFSLVNGQKAEPQPGLKGVCINCQSETIAKCGQVKLWHWAHKSKLKCDSWWENETEWHRAWKNKFPVEWQEVVHVDGNTNEKHIADIKTDAGLVIEFQHSAITSQEMQSREAFYQNMVWVVDGARLKRDFPRFRSGFLDCRKIVDGIFLSFVPEACFPKSWLANNAPVLLDFMPLYGNDNLDPWCVPLWCIFPKKDKDHVVFAGIARESFIDLAIKEPHLLLGEELLNKISQAKSIEEKKRPIVRSRIQRPVFNSRRFRRF